MSDSQRSRDLARAALLRERVIGALKAAPGPMTAPDLCGMSGIVELYHRNMLPHKVSIQLVNLRRQGIVTKVGRGQWELNRKREADATVAPQPDTLRQLQLEVHKADRTVTFVLEGLQITIKVLP